MHDRHPDDITDESPAAQMEMPRYISHKRVWALEIATIRQPADDEGSRILTFRDKGFAPIRVPPEMLARYVPLQGDFYVQYADGYKSFSPRKAFIEGYKPEGA